MVGTYKNDRMGPLECFVSFTIMIIVKSKINVIEIKINPFWAS